MRRLQRIGHPLHLRQRPYPGNYLSINEAHGHWTVIPRIPRPGKIVAGQKDMTFGDLNHIPLLANARTKRLILTDKIPRHSHYPLGHMHALKVRVTVAHDISDLDSFSVAVDTRYQEPVTSYVEGRVHRRALAELDSYQVLPDQRASAERASSIEREPANGAQIGGLYCRPD